MKKNIVATVCGLIVLLFGMHSARAAAADAEESLAKGLAVFLESGASKDVCTGGTEKLAKGLNGAWKSGLKAAFIWACNQNPKGPKLFPGSAEEDAKKKVKAYCDFAPVARLCMVCNLLTGESGEIKQAFEQCRGFLSAEEQSEFQIRVLGESAASAAGSTLPPKSFISPETLFGGEHQSAASIPSGEKGRADAKVYFPKNFSEKKEWPVVLLLHGYGESERFITKYFGLDNEVTKYGFILVVPEGLANTEGKHFWNASDGCCDFNHTQVDDVKYLTELVDQVAERFHGDKKRIYATGHSNGGFMSHRLACDGGGRFAAIASFAGVTMKDPELCKPQGPVSILQIHALNDDTIFYQGDKGYPGLAPYPGAVESVVRWSKLDECSASEKGGDLNLTTSIIGSDATSTIWRSCKNGTQVQLWTIEASDGALHFPHTPLLHQNFTDGILQFLLSQGQGAPLSK